MNVLFILGRHDVSISRHPLNKKKIHFRFFPTLGRHKAHEKEKGITKTGYFAVS